MLKKTFLVLLIAVIFLGSGIQAHSGHVLEATYLEEVKALKGAEFKILVDDEDAGSFTIKSAKVTSQGAKLKIEQEGVEKLVNALVTDEKILTYKFDLDGTEYSILIDFQNLSEGDNAGIRISYPEDFTGRVLQSEDIVVVRNDDDGHTL